VLAGFFDRANKGDLVVVPPPDLVGNVLIGELRDDPQNFENVAIPELFGTDEVPTRKVKWLTHVPKADLSLGMLRRFPRPNAFTLLDREF
jgi:predicted Mrr-cat superfamily restriction endonuclease